MGGNTGSGVRFISEILLEAGIVTDEQVQAGLRLQKETGARIGETLVQLGAATEEDIGSALARQLGIPFVDLQPDALDQDLIRSFPDGMLQRLLAVPLVRGERSLSVAFGDPTDNDAIAEFEQFAGVTIGPSAATPSAIQKVLERVAGSRPEGRSRLARTVGPAPFDAERDRSGARPLLEQLQRALEAGATEIHFAPESKGLRVFHRIGERLSAVGSEPAQLLYYLLARLESLGGPVIDGDGVHACGRVVCPLGDRDLPLDVSLVGCEDGVAITLGLHPRVQNMPALEDLGIEPVDLARLRALLELPSGLILISGPARSGCSMTLASLLAATPTDSRRSIAFERPTGTPLPAGVRLAHEPTRSRGCWEEIVVGQNVDVVALDDVLTGDAVNGVLSSAASGRLVLATTDWSDSFALLEHLFTRPGGRAVLAERLRLIMQQRLPRPLTGRKGAADRPARQRPALIEALFVSDAMREALRRGAGMAELRLLAVADGYRSLSDQMRALIAEGVVSETEATRLLS